MRTSFRSGALELLLSAYGRGSAEPGVDALAGQGICEVSILRVSEAGCVSAKGGLYGQSQEGPGPDAGDGSGDGPTHKVEEPFVTQVALV